MKASMREKVWLGPCMQGFKMQTLSRLMMFFLEGEMEAVRLRHPPAKQYFHSLETGHCSKSHCVTQCLGTLPALCDFSMQGTWDFPRCNTRLAACVDPLPVKKGMSDILMAPRIFFHLPGSYMNLSSLETLQGIPWPQSFQA